jgi:hypothetical protein
MNVQDAELADNVARMENIHKLNAACTALLSFYEDPDCISHPTSSSTGDATATATAEASGDGANHTVHTSTTGPDGDTESHAVVDGEAHDAESPLHEDLAMESIDCMALGPMVEGSGSAPIRAAPQASSEPMMVREDADPETRAYSDQAATTGDSARMMFSGPDFHWK